MISVVLKLEYNVMSVIHSNKCAFTGLSNILSFQMYPFIIPGAIRFGFELKPLLAKSGYYEVVSQSLKPTGHFYIMQHMNFSECNLVKLAP